MKIVSNAITIFFEIIVLILSVLWYVNTRDYESLIAIIVSTVSLFSSLISRYTSRPRIELHHLKTDWGRLAKGHTINNPPIIRLGIDKPDQYWELFWNYTLEIRNNSSQNAYSLEMEYKNIPEKTFFDGDIGKIEPLKANEKKEIKIKVVQNIIGTHIQADEYLKTNIKELMKDTKIMIKYKNENKVVFYSVYDWSTDSNRVKIIE